MEFSNEDRLVRDKLIENEPSSTVSKKITGKVQVFVDEEALSKL